MPYWYGDERCILEIVTGTAIWYHSGLPPAPIRWVLVRDPTGVRDPQAFLCTDLDATPVEILGMVREPVVHRNNIPGEPRASRRRNATSMVRPRHSADDAGAVRVVFARYAMGG